MRHQKKGFKLGRTHAHRKATLSALSSALITHKRITTTLTKARALRMHVEPIINRAKVDTMHSRRQVFRYLQNKHAVTELFANIAEKIKDRPGGYTRIIKLGQRAGDAAEMAIIELVDYNEDALAVATKESSRKRTRRGRRKKSDDGATASAASGAGRKKTKSTDAEEGNANEPEAETAVEEIQEVAEETQSVAESEDVDTAASENPEDEESAKKED